MEPSTGRAKIGAIGAGWWATTNHFPLLAHRDDVELVAVCRLGGRELEAVKSQFGFKYGTEDYRELLEMDLDGVVVASPHDLHYEHAAAALDRGLKVLCEKPMTLFASQAWDLVARSERSNAPLLIAYGWNYKPLVDQARLLLENPGVGTPEYVLGHMASPTKSFFSSRDNTVPSQFAGPFTGPDPATWQDPRRGGGYGHGQVTHLAGLLFWLVDIRAATVRALTTSPGAPVDLYDAASLTFASGAIGVISGAATLPDDDKFQVDIRIFGTEGVLLLDMERERLELRRHDGRNRRVDVPKGQGSYSCEGPVECFVDLVHGRACHNRSPGWVGARTVELLDALYRSASPSVPGRPVSVDLSLGR